MGGALDVRVCFVTPTGDGFYRAMRSMEKCHLEINMFLVYLSNTYLRLVYYIASVYLMHS